MCFSNYFVIHVRSQQSSYVAKVINVDHALSLVHTIKIYNILNILFSFFWFRALQKNLCQQKKDEGARDVINNAYCISVHVYDDIPVDAVCELETSPEENNEEVEEQSTLYDKCWRNEYDKTQSAMDEYNRDTEHTYMVPVSDSISLWRLHTHVQSLRRRLSQLRNEIPPTFTTH